MKQVHPGMMVCLTDGGTGTVTDVLVDAQTGEERYLVLSVDGYWGPLRVAPSSTVWQVGEQVHLGLTGHEAATLPVFAATAYGPTAGLRRRMPTTDGAPSASAP